MRTLLVVPVKQVSRTVPGKNTKPLAGGSSCLERLLRTVRQVEGETVVIAPTHPVGVTVQYVTEPTIIAGQNGQRALDPVVWYATAQMEERTGQPYDTVVSCQVTSPFTRPETIREAIAIAEQGRTALTVREDRALRWTGKPDLQLSAHAPLRLPREHMAPCWRETGAVVATPRQYVTPLGRFAPTVELLPVTGAQAVDIDTLEDWVVAEWYARQGA